MPGDKGARPRWQSAAERDVVVAASGGDRAAFRELYERHVQAIVQYVAKRVPRDDVEDIAADTFTRAWAALPRFEWRGAPFRAWLYRIAQNAIVSRYRRKFSDHDSLEDHDEHLEVGSFEESLVEGFTSSAVLVQLAALSDRQRLVLELRFLRELSVGEVSELLDLSDEGVRALTYRALRSLRTLIEPAEPGVG